MRVLLLNGKKNIKGPFLVEHCDIAKDCSAVWRIAPRDHVGIRNIGRKKHANTERARMRKVCLFATQHQFQLDSPMDSAFDGRLRELIQDHKVDCVLEEATSLRPKSCVELLADELKIHWDNIDLSAEERRNTPDAALTSKYDTLQDLTLHSTRESAWVQKISDTVVQSGLVIVGLCHLLSMGEKLRALDFEVEAHLYDPKRIYDWTTMRPRVGPLPASTE